MALDPIETAALGRPLFPGMLYDCRRDSFIPGVTLWDKKSLSKDLDIRPHLQTDLKFSSSDSLASKFSLMNISASLKASFLSGLVEVEGSAKYLRDTKSSNQQARVTMYYSETSRFEQLTMTQLGKITYPQVFDQQTATHVVTAVLYGAQAFMVFDWSFSEEENKQEIKGELNAMVKKISSFSINGEGHVEMSQDDKNKAENIACTFHGDFHLKQTPTTYLEALELYKQLPILLKDNAVPIRVWLYPLHLLDNKAAQLKTKISTSLISKTQDIMEGLEKAERTHNDLSGNTLANVFSDVKERLSSFQESFNIYKVVLRKAVARVLPGIRGGGMKEESLSEILKIHYESPFNVSKLNQWLHDAESELLLLSSYIKTLDEIKIEDSDSLNTILLDPDVDAVVCLTFTSLKYEDPYLEALREYLKSDKFKKLDGGLSMVSVPAVKKWFRDPDVITHMRNNLLYFRDFLEANKDDKRICFIISAISDSSDKGSSIYLYKNGKRTDTQFQPVSKPPPPVICVQDQAVILELFQSPTGETVEYRVEYKQEKFDSGAEESWLAINTPSQVFNLTGLESGKLYLIRYRVVGTVGVSEASDTVCRIPSSAQPLIVGGTEGSEVTFMTPSITTIKKITIYQRTFSLNPLSCLLTAIHVLFKSGDVIEVGNNTESNEKELLFDDNDKIITATLWPSKDKKGLGGLEFIVTKSDGTTTKKSIKTDDVGDPVNVDVKSGKCYCIAARSGEHLNALGFCFI